MTADERVIWQTREWITKVVVACNFCPFAGRELQQDHIHFQVENAIDAAGCLQAFATECKRLDDHPAITTTLLILPMAYPLFQDYLHLLSLAEKWLKQQGYEGNYQLASFHPQYLFAGAPLNDPANYTNRSMYPMLHLLREDSIDQAIAHYPDTDKIPNRNIVFARSKGLAHMKTLRDACL